MFIYICTRNRRHYHRQECHESPCDYMNMYTYVNMFAHKNTYLYTSMYVPAINDHECHGSLCDYIYMQMYT